MIQMKTRAHTEKGTKATAWSVAPFKGLKKVLEKNQFMLHTKERPVTKTDEEVFRDAMADVREIKEFRKLPPKKPPKIRHVAVRQDDSIEMLHQIIDGKRKITLSHTGEYVGWISPHVRKDVLWKLHNGEFSVQDSIDLHGMTLGVAEEAFAAFFREALHKHLFCIKIIHGRGLRSPHGPVLKEALIGWIHGTFRKWILAYSTAKNCDGGLGATYILLRAK